MTDDDLDCIEGRLGVSLPPEYRDFAKNYPGDLDAECRENEIWSDPDDLIDATLRGRFGEFSETRWGYDVVAIGSSGCGDYYCLDVSQVPAPVLCWNHENSNFEYTASSIRAWYRKVKQTDL